MASYVVPFTMTVSGTVIIDATSPAEAKDLVENFESSKLLEEGDGISVETDHPRELTAKEEAFQKSYEVVGPKGLTSMVDKIMRYEQGEMDQEEMVQFFQELINNGMAWTLQGSYGRTATSLIDAGLCTRPEKKDTDPSEN